MLKIFTSIDITAHSGTLAPREKGGSYMKRTPEAIEAVTKLKARVHKGALLLDTQKPWWFEVAITKKPQNPCALIKAVFHDSFLLGLVWLECWPARSKWPDVGRLVEYGFLPQRPGTGLFAVEKELELLWVCWKIEISTRHKKSI